MNPTSDSINSISRQAIQMVKGWASAAKPETAEPQAESVLDTDSFTPSSQDGLGDLNEIISRNKKLRALSGSNPDMLFGEQSKSSDKGFVRKIFDSYVENVDVPGPYGSPEPKDWPKRSEAGQVGKWNDQVNYVTKNGTTAEMIVQRGALTTAVAATSIAVATGAAELKLGKQIIVDGPKVRGGRIFQVRPKGEPGFFRLDLHPLGKHAPKGLEGVKLPHYHRVPNMSLHRPFQGF